MTSAQEAISIPVAYIEALTMMLGAFIIGYVGCYIYYNKRLKRQQQQSLEKNQSLRKRITELKEEVEQQDRALSYRKDRMDQDYDQVGFNNRAFSEKILDQQIDSKIKIDFDSIGYASEKDKDNLQEIQGIGPYTEEKLNTLGIYTFEQISKLTEENIQAVTDLIRFFPGRIKNDKWVGKAQNLIYKEVKSKQDLEDDDYDNKNKTHKKTTL